MLFVSPIPTDELATVVGEYFVDTEPGIGNGIPFSITAPADSIEENFVFDLPVLSLGEHVFYIRYKNEAGAWSMVEPRPFLVCEDYASQAEFDFSTSDDLAFFFDQSSSADSVHWEFGDGEISNDVNPVHLYQNAGQFTVKQKTFNTCGNDSAYQFVDINGVNAMTPNFSANTNFMMMNVTGAGFTNDMQVKLVRAGEEIIGQNVVTNESHYLSATFNFVNETIGLWDLVVIIDGSFSDTLLDGFSMQAPSPINLNTYISSPGRVLANRYQKILVNVTNEGNQSAFGLQHFVKFPSEFADVKLLSEMKSTSLAAHKVDSILNGMVITIDPLTQDSVYSGHYIIPMLGPGQTATLIYSVFPTQVQSFNTQSVIGNSIFSPAQVAQLLSGNINFTPTGLSTIAARSAQIPFANLNPNTNITAAIASLVNGIVTNFPFNSPTPAPVNSSPPNVPNLISINHPVGCSGCGNFGLPASPGVTSPIPAITEVGVVLFDPFLPEVPEDTWEFTEQDLEDWVVNTDPATDVVDDTAEDIVDLVEEDTGEDVWEFTEEDLEEEEPWEFTPEEICGGSCNPVGPIQDNEGDEQDREVMPVVASFDPNAIYGPVGFTEEQYVPDNLRMDYRITFENIDTATANAVEVKLNSFLDTNLYDISSFRYEAFGFGEFIYALAPFRKEFTSELNLEGLQNCILRVSGQSPQQDGMLEVYFESLHLETRELIDNPDDGFLPPNVEAPNGEGFLIFSVRQKDNLPHLTEIPISASIIFDSNAPIVTNIHNNIIDVEAPSSNIEPIPTIVQDEMITLQFNKNDENSGVQVVDVYASINGAEYVLITRTNSDSLQVILVPESSYEFYTVAIDFCGNIEEIPDAPDVSTTYTTGIDESVNFLSFRIYPVPANDFINCTYNLSMPSSVQISILDMKGNLCLQKNLTNRSSGKSTELLDVGGLAQGVYVIRLTGQNATVTEKLVIK
jgi:PKD repeat protein